MPMQGLTHKKSAGHYAGHNVEPTQPNGPKVGGKHPPVHSHSARHKRNIKAGGRKR